MNYFEYNNKIIEMTKLSLFRLQILLAALFLYAGSVMSQGITTPRTPSPASSVKQTIGISTVTVDYSRPSVRNREIWGKLVPYGWNKQGFGNNKMAPWRAGANENTVLTLSHAAKIEGKKVPAGKYGLFFVINENNAGEVILSKDNRSWGSFFYEEDRDQMKSKISLRDIAHTEALTYEFINLSKNGAELVLNWEKKQFPVKIEFDVDKLVMDNAEDELKGTAGFSWQGYQSAANYGLANNVELEKAMDWIDKAIAINNSFTTLNTKGQLLLKMGKKDEAEKLMESALLIATEPEVNAYGYQILNQGNHDKAIEILKMNTKNYPNSANAWDSLGEGYFTKGDTKNAIAAFKKSLSLNPAPNVKANSEKFLSQLGSK